MAFILRFENLETDESFSFKSHSTSIKDAVKAGVRLATEGPKLYWEREDISIECTHEDGTNVYVDLEGNEIRDS